MTETFEKNPLGTNELLQGDGFYLSFNRAPCAEWGALFAGDGGSSETALAIEKGLPDGETAWLILNGDFRAEYQEAFPRGLAACVAVYESHRATSRSSWSSDGDWTMERVLEWLAARVSTETTGRES